MKFLYKLEKFFLGNPINLVVLTILIGGAIFCAFIPQIKDLTNAISEAQKPTPIPVIIEKPAESPAPAEIQGPESAPVESKPVQTYQQPSQSTTTTAPQPEADQGGHIPFTNKPVTSGDPQSYVDTVGQCPFYEMAGEKGCVPPADISCNSDWTICEYLGQ
jgi:hypothetical protein